MSKHDMSGSEKKKKKHPILKAILIILIAAIAIGYFVIRKAYKEFEAESNAAQVTIVGTEAQDFMVTTTDGSEFSLSETLKEKEVVVLNIFATWCGPCEHEFPGFEEVYQKYQDKMEIVAVSTDSSDSLEDVTKYKADHNLTFTMGFDGNDVLSFVPVVGFPTTVIIDRNGKIMFCQTGAFPTTESFEDVVTGFMGDNYKGEPVFNYMFAPYADDAYLPGVTFKVTSDDGTETEITTGDSGVASIRTSEPHTYTARVTAVPDGYTVPSGNDNVGPQSGWAAVEIKK